MNMHYISYDDSGTVGLHHVSKHIFTTGTMDIVNLNSCLKIAIDSFYGAAFSLAQHLQIDLLLEPLFALNDAKSQEKDTIPTTSTIGLAPLARENNLIVMHQECWKSRIKDTLAGTCRKCPQAKGC